MSNEMERRLHSSQPAISIAARACTRQLVFAASLLPNVARAMLIVSINPALLDESDSELVLALPGRARYYTTPAPQGWHLSVHHPCELSDYGLRACFRHLGGAIIDSKSRLSQACYQSRMDLDPRRC